MTPEVAVPVAVAMAVECHPVLPGSLEVEHVVAWRNMTAPAPQAINNPLGYHANFDGDA